MAVQRFFEISYRFKEERKTFIQPDRTMSDSDAWYYACLHARIGVLHNTPDDRSEQSALERHAMRHHLTDVRWEELP